MPNYLANRAFANVAEMKAFLLDDTDEDLLGPFIIPVDTNDFKLVVWRRYSTRTADDVSTFTANGPGRWIVLQSGGGGGNTPDAIDGSTYWNRLGTFASIEEFTTNSKNYSLKNWLSPTPGSFLENSNA